MAMCDRTFADVRPHTPGDGLQADAVLVRGENLDRFAGALCGLFGNSIGEPYPIAEGRLA
jgi:hypothetical protein